MKKLTLVLVSCAVLCALLCGCGRVVKTDGQIAVIPLPESVVAGEGVFRMKPSTKIVMLLPDQRASYVSDALSEILLPLLGRVTVLGGQIEPRNGAVNILYDESLRADAYTLDITPKRVDIKAGSAEGAYYAVQTLRQLIPAEVYGAGKIAGFELPALSIVDKPALSYRGQHLDVCRHFFTVDEVKTALDIMALHKLNIFHWHLTDDQGWRVEIKKYPKLTEIGSMRQRTLIGRDPGVHWRDYENCQFDNTPYGGFYTQDQIREVVDYAARRFITVIPEIEFPGHAVAALASYPDLGCTGEQFEVRPMWHIDERVFCIGKDTTFDFMEGVLSEIIELFPSQYIHIGGDECPTDVWERCPHCKARMKAEKLTKPRQLQNYATARVESFLAAHDRRIIGWDEIMEGGILPSAVIMSWRGTQGGIRAAQHGNHAIMVPTSYCYFDYYQAEDRENEPLAIGGFVPVEKVYSLDPLAGLNADEQQFILGVQANLWTEYIATFDHVQYMLLPRMSALAEVGWSADRKNYDDYLRRVQHLAKIYDACGYNYAKHVIVEKTK